jgi:RNA polymerase sigma-70 factor (ECF subfamily)
LLGRLRNGNQDAATQLYQRYAERLHTLMKAQCSTELARRVEPDDLVQSVFCTFFQKASQGLYDVPAGETLWGLLLVLALNKIRTKWAFHSAARRNVRLTSEEGDSGAPAFEDKNQDDFALTFLQMVIAETLEPLAPPYRAMIEFRIEGHEVAEIAQKTGRSRRTVERVLQSFRNQLDKVLHEEA